MTGVLHQASLWYDERCFAAAGIDPSPAIVGLAKETTHAGLAAFYQRLVNGLDGLDPKELQRYSEIQTRQGLRVLQGCPTESLGAMFGGYLNASVVIGWRGHELHIARQTD